MKRLSCKIALLGAIFFFSGALQAQDIESVIEQMAEDGASEADVEDYLQQVARDGRRLSLNSASREQLEASGLFTPFQIASLLEYREEYGELLSMLELPMIDGFTKEFAARIASYVTLEKTPVSGPLHVEVRSRYKYKKGVKGVHQYNRLVIEKGSLKGGLLAESDAGEIPLVDYVGGYLSFCKGRWEILAGDYNARFGQGLTLWNAFNFTGASAPASVMRRPKGITPYKSADESRALRGMAVAWSPDSRWKVSAFASAKGVDANVTAAGYTSLPATGYHRTIYEKRCKNAMREYLLGADITLTAGLLQTSVTAAAYTYSAHNARKEMPYNQFQLYDGWWGNMSAAVCASRGHWRFFAEAAVDAGSHVAAVAGAHVASSYSFEASVMLRYYDKAYIAPHAGAYSTITSVSNQQGAVLSLLWRPARGLLVTSFSEAVYYPGQRYRIPEPSAAMYERLGVEYTAGQVVLSLKDNYVWQSADASHKHSLRASAKGEWGRWKGALRSGAVRFSAGGERIWGLAASLSAACDIARGKWNLSASASVYKATDYDARVYLYESDLPGGFSANYCYGKGIAARCMVRYKPARKLTLTGIVVLSGTPECRLQADYSF